MPGPNKIRSISAERLADTNMRTNMDTNREQEQVAKAHATREHASALLCHGPAPAFCFGKKRPEQYSAYICFCMLALTEGATRGQLGFNSN